MLTGKISLAVAFALLASSPAHAINLTVKAGRTSHLFPIFQYNPTTCAPVNKPKYQLTQPKNGKFKVIMDTAIGKRGVCKGVKVRVQWLMYTPNRGFKGVDRGAIAVENKRFDAAVSGSRIEHVTIKVE